jgi:hypothetical protein
VPNDSIAEIGDHGCGAFLGRNQTRITGHTRVPCPIGRARWLIDLEIAVIVDPVAANLGAWFALATTIDHTIAVIVDPIANV